MTDDNELERRQFMSKPVPAKPKVAGAPPPTPMMDKLVPPPAPVDPFADFAQIVKLLRRHDSATRMHIMELLIQLID